MSSLKKWRLATSDTPHVPIYCVPGLLEYAVGITKDHAVAWADALPDGPDATGRWVDAVAGIGPCRMPATLLLLVGGDTGLLVSTRADGDCDLVSAAIILGYGTQRGRGDTHMTVAKSGRAIRLWLEPAAEDVAEEEARGCMLTTSGVVLVFSQIFRRHRERIERVSTGNRRRGTAGYRGEAYVVRGISEVLRHYRKLDGKETVRSGGKQRWHMRAGHFVLLNTPREYWRNPCEAGDERLGRIVKDYSLPKYQRREANP